MSNRDSVQTEALRIALNHNKCGLAISMGVGKTLIGLRYLESLLTKNSKKFLVVAPKISIFQSWREDAEKFGILPEVLGKVEFTTYVSLSKKNPDDYDVLVLDECHSLLNSHEQFLKRFKGNILGLTGTPPRYSTSDKGQLVGKYCPIKYSYIVNDAVKDSILNDYQIIVHKIPLSGKDTMILKSKAGGQFYSSEIKTYKYWSDKVSTSTSRKEHQIFSIMRMKAMMDFPSKEHYAKYLLRDIEDKCIVFCNTQDQADRICDYSVHSKNEQADENLELFKKDKINQLSCVLQLSEGINIPNLRAGIILHAYGNERKSTQRIGRLLRLNPDDKSTVHILCYKGSIDEKWVEESLRDFDQSKILYHDVNPNDYE